MLLVLVSFLDFESIKRREQQIIRIYMASLNCESQAFRVNLASFDR